MNIPDLLRLIKNYGHYCGEACHWDARGMELRSKACDNKATLELNRIEKALASLPLCTGVSAGWCPIHGDCTCVEGSENFHNDENCPLHSAASTHAEGVTE